MFNKEKLAHHHGLLAWVIALLLGLILIVLVFKTGMMVGGSKSHFSSCQAGNYYKNFSGHLGGKFIGWKKSQYENFEAKAEAMGMTMEEYKAYLAEEKSEKVE